MPAARASVLKNDYLVITDSVLEPRSPGRIWHAMGPNAFASDYRAIISQSYGVVDRIVLPGGGETTVDQRIR